MKLSWSEQLKSAHVLFSMAPHLCVPFARFTFEWLHLNGSPFDQVATRCGCLCLCRPNQAVLSWSISVRKFITKVKSSSSYRVTRDADGSILHSCNESLQFFPGVPVKLKMRSRFVENVKWTNPVKMKDLFYSSHLQLIETTISWTTDIKCSRLKHNKNYKTSFCFTCPHLSDT